MGKSKALKKKSKSKSSSLSSNVALLETGSHAGLTSLTQARDGHNVNGWTESQIKAYNELLLEREKLEKQRKELEQRSASSQAGRALLNQSVFDIDSVFEQQTNGTYKFTSSKRCCVDINSSTRCHHEICAKSKTEGLTHTEMDIVKYYHMRIFSEKSERIRDALRKQRDQELSKLQKDKDLSKDLNTRLLRNGHSNTLGPLDSSNVPITTKETQRLITRILDRLENLRSDLQNGRISSPEMQRQLDIIDAEMHAAHLKTSKFKKRVIGSATSEPGSQDGALAHPRAELAANGKSETYNKAFHIMENFLNASKPGDFQHAITQIKDVLRLSGPIGEDLKGSFAAVEGIFDSPDRLSFAGPDGMQECTSIIDLMEKMKETLHRTGKLPDGANTELTRVFQECIDLETKGKNLLNEEYDKITADKSHSEVKQALTDVRASVVSKSPIPPLTEKTLENQISTILEKHDVLCLLAKVNEGIGSAAIEGYMTSMVMCNAQRDPAKYVESIQRLALVYNKLKGQDIYPILDTAFPNVEAKMGSFVAKLAEKKKQETRVPALDTSSSTLTSLIGDATNLLNEFPAKTAEIVADAIRKMAEHDEASEAHLPLHRLISDYGSSGLWPIWLFFAEETNFAEDQTLQEKSQHFEKKVDDIISKQQGGLRTAILYLYQEGVCPGLCAAVVSEILASVSEFNREGMREYISDLACCISDLPHTIDIRWRTAFGHLTLAMVQLYIALHMHVSHRFPHLHPVDFSLSTVAMVTSYVCLMSSSHLATENLKLICVFLNVCMSPDGIEPVREIIEVAKHYESFCKNDDYRCLTSQPCSHHFKPTPRADSNNPVVVDKPTRSFKNSQSPPDAALQANPAETSFSGSRFSEHIDDVRSQTMDVEEPVSTEGGSNFETSANTLNEPEDIEGLVEYSKETALSGSYGNPVAQYVRLAHRIWKSNDSSPSVWQALVRGREEVEDSMSSLESHSAWTTRRMEWLLASRGVATVPNRQCLYNLAKKSFSMFEEYAALLAGSPYTDGQGVTLIKSLCDDVFDRLGEGTLTSDSTSIQQLSEIGLGDWARRKAGVGKPMHHAYAAFEDILDPEADTQTDIISRLQQFCVDLRDLENTRDKIESLTGQPSARKRQVKVFDDLVGELNQTRGVIMDVASIIAKNRKSTELETFIKKNSGKASSSKQKLATKVGSVSRPRAITRVHRKK